MSFPAIYLDNNATTKIDPRVIEAMNECWAIGPLNPSSQHAAGRVARRLLDDACVEIARLLGANIQQTGGDQLLITSGGTESNLWALQSLVDTLLPRWISTIEHPSMLMPAQMMADDRHASANDPLNKIGPLRKSGPPMHFLNVDRDGRILPETLAASLEQLLPPLDDQPPGSIGTERGLVSIMAANNETGVLQDLPALAKVCRQFGVIFHSDATQWVGKLPLNFRESGLDALTFTPHKFHGPIGVGGLLLRSGVKIDPMLIGGQQQLGMRAGTEPVALVVGMATALRLATDRIEQTAAAVTELRLSFEAALLEQLPDSAIHGISVNRLPGTTCVSFPGIDRQTLMLLLDRQNIACSTGSACTSGSSEPSHVLRAMGLPADRIESSLRFGLSKFSTSNEVDQAIERIVYCVNKLRNRSVVEKGVEKSFDFHTD